MDVLTILLSLLVATSAWGVVEGPNTALVQSASISISPRVAAMEPDATTTTGMSAQFRLAVDVKLKPGAGLVGYRWQNREGIPPMEVDGVIIKGNANNGEAVGYVTSPGAYKTKVGIIIQVAGNPPDTEPSVFVWTDCRAIGG